MLDSLCCVLAVHNEERFLPYSVGALNELGCKVVVVLDRCSDSSERIVKASLVNTFVYIKQKSGCRFSMSESKNIGCEIARQNGAELLLISDADVILDVGAVKRALNYLASSCFVVLAYREYSLFGSAFYRFIDELHNLFSAFVRKFRVHPVRAGIFVGLAELMVFKDKSGEYDYLQRKHRTAWIKTDTLHLRPRWDRESQISRGAVRARLPQYSLFKVLLTSFLLLQPLTVVGYLKEKLR